MPYSRSLKATGLIAALALLTACSTNASTASVGSGSAGTEDPVAGGTMVYADVKPLTNVQTQQGRNYEVNNVLNNMLDRLLYWDGENQELVPWIAEEFSSNEDATEFTFTLREGVTFSNGEPLDAAAVKANLDVFGLGHPAAEIPPNQDFVNYESTEVVDERTVVVHLSAPNTHFLKATAAVTAGLVSPSTLELDNAGQSSVSTIVGSGPFVFESQVPDQEVVLTRRDDYAWPAASSANEGAAYLEKVVIRVLSEVGLRSGALQSDQVDVVRNIQPIDETALSTAGYQVIPVPANDLTVNYLGLRSGEQALSDPKVRRALQIGFDRQMLKQVVLSDSYQLAGSVISHSSRGFVDLSDHLAYDPEEANRLLDEAGWAKAADGLRYRDGKPLEVTASSSTASVVIRPALEFIEQQWRQELGVTLVNRGGDDMFYAKAMTEPSVEVFAIKQNFYGGLGPLFGPETNSTTFVTHDRLNELFETERTSTDESIQLEALARQQEEIILGTSSVIPLWDEVLVHAAEPDVHVEFTQAAAPIFHESWNAEE